MTEINNSSACRQTGKSLRPPLRLCAFALLCACALIFILKPPSMAQYGQAAKDQVFDYNPKTGDEEPQIAKGSVEMDYSDIEIRNDPVKGVLMLVKSRWKNWVVRAVYLMLLYAAIVILQLSLSKNAEYNIIIAYILSGASFLLSFWVFLCAVILFRLRSETWIYILPVSAAMAVISDVLLMKLKRSDVSFSELKESFQRSSAAANEDKRLASVEGGPGDWSDQDFLK